jgi:hypothetical protein
MLLSPVDIEAGQAVESGGGVTTDDDGFCCFWVVHRSSRMGRHQTLKLFRDGCWSWEKPRFVFVLVGMII